MKMYMEPVTIEIKDDKSYSLVAHTVDQDEIQRDIYDIRKGCNLLKKFIDTSNFDRWMDESHDFCFTTKAYDYYSHAQDRVIELEVNPQSETDVYSEKNNSSQHFIKKFAYLHPMKFEVEYLLLKHSLPACCKTFLLKAIICNKVKIEDTKDLGSEQFEYEIFFNNKMFISDQKQFNEHTQKKEKIRNRYKNEIKRDRKWYWMYQIEKTKRGAYDRMLTKWNDENPKNLIDDTGNITTAVNRYRDFLQTKLPIICQ